MADIRTAIEEAITATEKSIRDLEAQTDPVAPSEAIGRLTRMEAIQSKAVNERALDEFKLRLAKLKIARDRCEQPGFGECLKCGDAIPMARLLASPENPVCVDCLNHMD